MNKLFITICVGIMCIALGSALQFQLLTNGTLISSNVTNGTLMTIMVINNTIYLVELTPPEIMQNITYTNITYTNITYTNVTNENYTYIENITYENITCLNCTNTYVSNKSLKGELENFTYNKGQIDSKINSKTSGHMSNSEANGKFALKSEINNTSQTIVQGSSHKTLWAAFTILALVLIIGGWLMYREL